MSNFALICAALVVISLLAMLYPLLRKPTTEDDDLRRARYRLHESILTELADDVAQGRLGADEYNQSVAEAEARLVVEVGRTGTTAKATPRSRKLTLAGVGILFPLAAGLLYFQLGSPAALNPENRAAPPAEVMSAAKIESMVKSLEAKMALEPGNTEGWLMLARSYRILARYDEAVTAYEKAWPLVQNNAGELTRFAGSLAVRDNTFAGRPTQLLTRALEMSPKEPDALMLAGSAAIERGDFSTAIDWWNKLVAQLEPGSEDEKWLLEQIRKIKEEQARAADKAPVTNADKSADTKAKPQ